MGETIKWLRDKGAEDVGKSGRRRIDLGVSRQREVTAGNLGVFDVDEGAAEN